MKVDIDLRTGRQVEAWADEEGLGIELAVVELIRAGLAVKRLVSIAVPDAAYRRLAAEAIGVARKRLLGRG